MHTGRAPLQAPPNQALNFSSSSRLAQNSAKTWSGGEQRLGLPEHGCNDFGIWGSFCSVLPKAGQLIRSSAKFGAGFLSRWGGCPLQMGHFLPINQVRSDPEPDPAQAFQYTISHNVYYVRTPATCLIESAHSRFPAAAVEGFILRRSLHIDLQLKRRNGPFFGSR